MKILIKNKQVHLALLPVSCQSNTWSDPHTNSLKDFRLCTSQPIHKENLFKLTWKQVRKKMAHLYFSSLSLILRYVNTFLKANKKIPNFLIAEECLSVEERVTSNITRLVK